MSLGGFLSIGRALGKVPARPVAYHDVGGWAPDFRGPEGGGGGGAPPVSARVPGSPAESGRARSGRGSASGAGGALASDGSGVREAGHGRGTGAARKHLVQGELALSSVRVVRNDLYADDLELIPRPGSSVGRMTLRPDRPRSVVARGGWRGWLAHWRQWLRGGAR